MTAHVHVQPHPKADGSCTCMYLAATSEQSRRPHTLHHQNKNSNPSKDETLPLLTTTAPCNHYSSHDSGKHCHSHNCNSTQKKIHFWRPFWSATVLVAFLLGGLILTLLLFWSSNGFYTYSEYMYTLCLYRPRGTTAIGSSATSDSANSGSRPNTIVKAVLSNPADMGVRTIAHRHDAALPSAIWGTWYQADVDTDNHNAAHNSLPTNSWYLNLVSHKASSAAPDDSTSVYTVPYSIDTACRGGGLRIHWPVLQATAQNIQMVDDYKNSLSLGSILAAVSHSPSASATVAATESSFTYRVHPHVPLSPLSITLQWNDSSTVDIDNNQSRPIMVTHLVRGMPFVTMHYYFDDALPRLYSYNGLASDIIVTGVTLHCGVGTMLEGDNTLQIDSELKLHFVHSDFTWIVFFSRPVKVACLMSSTDEDTRDFTLDVVAVIKPNDDVEKKEENSHLSPPLLTVRVALLDQCTTGKSDIHQHCLPENLWNSDSANRTQGDGTGDDDEKNDNTQSYEELLRQSAMVYPTSPKLELSYPSADKALISIDWMAQSLMTSINNDAIDQPPLLMFALPHHQDMLHTNDESSSVATTGQCINTFHGSTCLVRGNKWILTEDLGRPMSFRAPRPPEAQTIPLLADAIASDIRYRLSLNLQRGAADTYFSGKDIARVARVIVIADELRELASSSRNNVRYEEEDGLALAREAASLATLPSADEISSAVAHLKQSVQIWLSGSAEAPYLYDQSWGGLVNCGCRYVGKDEHGYCNNTFPDCPALMDVNEDFGNGTYQLRLVMSQWYSSIHSGFYNDHHYHYGYHVYGAAVVAKFDPEWAMEYFDRVLLYIRDFANPFDDDYFPKFRQKDWFLGSSWASGIVSAENSPHGRNEESSSEAIAAYEAVALYGSVMEEIFVNDERVHMATTIRSAGQLLTASEVHATNRYWHVWSSKNHVNTYSKEYEQPVVGMLYETMATFQTWFSPQVVVSYGIQLMPLTPVAEQRDNPEWASILYPRYKETCIAAGAFCVDNGWSILQAGLLATAGDKEGALQQALAIPATVFDTQGGLGNSLTNTIWFIATRKNY